MKRKRRGKNTNILKLTSLELKEGVIYLMPKSLMTKFFSTHMLIFL